MTAAVATLLIVAGVAAGDMAPASAQSHDTKVRPVVQRALQRDGSVRVLVSLRQPPALAAATVDVASARKQVAATQQRALAGVPTDAFETDYRYQALPLVAGVATAEGVAALSARPDVIEIDLDGRGEAALNQARPITHVDEVQATGLTGAGVVVAVLDSGVDTNHADLESDILYERCFLVSGTCPAPPHVAEDDQGHGTNVTGIITGDGTVAPIGVAPDAMIASYKILAANGVGFFSDWFAALDDIIANHPEVDIVNMSLQSGVSCPHTAMTTAIETLRKQGVATFVASGNHGRKFEMTVPACVSAGISVGAVYDGSIGIVNGWKTECSDATAADTVACWSDADGGLDLLAPGAAITSTGRTGATSTFFGTSQAAPHAAGIAALLLETSPGMSVDELEKRMEATGTLIVDDLDDGIPGTDRTTPRVDARVALISDDADDDGDGCRTGEELGAVARAGGRRNPLNPHDFYDVNGDGVVNMFGDILPVIAAFGPSSGPKYQASLDRSAPPPGAEPWDMGPPDGAITLADVTGVAAQFGHRCQGA